MTDDIDSSDHDDQEEEEVQAAEAEWRQLKYRQQMRQ